MIAIGNDGAGFDLKPAVLDYLKKNNLAFSDMGSFSNSSVDYPVFAKAVVNEVLSGRAEKGIIICGTGIGVSMVANRFDGIRCAVCGDVFSAKAARLHNDANILALGARVLGAGLALEIVNAFLNTEFSLEERHARRIGMINSKL